jgi:hypothetical protein
VARSYAALLPVLSGNRWCYPAVLSDSCQLAVFVGFFIPSGKGRNDKENQVGAITCDRFLESPPAAVRCYPAGFAVHITLCGMSWGDRGVITAFSAGLREAIHFASPGCRRRSSPQWPSLGAALAQVVHLQDRARHDRCAMPRRTTVSSASGAFAARTVVALAATHNLSVNTDALRRPRAARAPGARRRLPSRCIA